MTKGQRTLLPPEEEARLQQLAQAGPAQIQQRAKAILAWHEGLSANDTAKRTGLSLNQVQYLWRAYKRKGLDLFLVEEEDHSQAAAEPSEASATVSDDSVPLTTLLAEHKVDMDHAQYVGDLAMQLFDNTQSIHRLPQSSRQLLQAAALVHNIAYEIDPPNHHLRGRDILMSVKIRGFSEDEQRILACTTAFHRKKVRPEAEPVYQALSLELRAEALALSAILRVADGFDHSVTQTTTIADLHIGSDEVMLTLEGDSAVENAAQSQKKADLWNQVFPTHIRISAAQPEPEARSESGAVPLNTLLRGAGQPFGLNESMSANKAGKLFALHTLERMESLVKYLQRGELSALPSLARESVRLLEGITLSGAKTLRKEAQWFAQTIESTRVALALAERALNLGDEVLEQSGVQAQVNRWQQEAREATSALDLARFEKLVAELRAALTAAEEADHSKPASFSAASILWEQLSELRTVMELGESVNAALAAVQRLQDQLTAFRELLGSEVAQVLDMLSPLESYLSAIQVAQAVLTLLESKPTPPKRGRRSTKAVTPPTVDVATEALKSAQTELIEMLADSLAGVWARVNSPIFRRAFALAIAAS